MATIEDINTSLKNVHAVIKAADAVIKNPKTDFQTELAKQGSSKKLATAFATTGAVGLVAATGAAGISTGITGLLTGLGAAVGAATISGPIGWTVGGAVIAFGGYKLYRKYQSVQKAKQEKERMLNEIIQKQQAIINKLKDEKTRNAQEIKNLRETLSVLEELMRKMKNAA